MMLRSFRLATAIALFPLASAMAQRPIKVYISVDMEGVAGAVTADQLLPSGFEYERFRQFMTSEALAAIQGARDAGATEFVVSDSHGNQENLLIEQFPQDVTIIRSSPRPLGMMEGIDSSFAAAVFIGYHASTTSPAGVRAHTFSSANLAGVQLNGIYMDEAGFNAAIAGEFGVPVVAISGDNYAVAEAQRIIGPIEGAVVKRAISFHSAATMTPAGRPGTDSRESEGRGRTSRRVAALCGQGTDPPGFDVQELSSCRGPDLSAHCPAHLLALDRIRRTRYG